MSQEREQRATILLVEEDDETRSLLRSNLQGYGYRVVIALDEEDALERVSGGDLQAELVLVDTVGVSLEDALSSGRGIREQAGYDGHTPLVVMAEKYGPDLAGTDVNVANNDWITYLELPGQLKNLLARLIDKLAIPDAPQEI
jgi:two-component system chemotaxis sensor kinase CheA